MTLPFHILDVFTSTPFLGNPLAVVTIPPNISLTAAQKQRIAKEFNLSETTFVHDVADRSTTDERRFDIYTPQSELPFAGHPTIGTAVHLHDQGVRTLVVKAGRITIESANNGSGLLRAAIPHNVHLHQKRLPDPTKDERYVVGSAKDVAAAEKGAPLFSIVRGMTFALIELPTLELLGAARVGEPCVLPADLLDYEWCEGWVTRRYYYVRLGSEESNGRVKHRIRTRLIKPATEDPATGSAACALASYLSLYEVGGNSNAFEIVQGVEMGRDSTIFIDVEVGESSSGEKSLESVHLGGTAVRVASGNISIPSSAENL
jgi:PhzF family phenazine biosynthesis protein